MDHRDEYLKTRGRAVYNAEDIVIGDIIAIPNTATAQTGNIRLYWVKKIRTEDTGPKFRGMTPYPCVDFLKTHVGFNVDDNLEMGERYVHSPSGRSKTTWYPDRAAVKKWWVEIGDIDEEGEEGVEDFWKHEGHVVEDEYLKKLGNLIPQAELPEFHLMISSRDKDEVFSKMEKASQAVKAAKKAFNEIMEISGRSEMKVEIKW